MEDYKKPSDLCYFNCVTAQWALTVIKLLRFFLYELLALFLIE